MIRVPANNASNSSCKFTGLPPLVKSKDRASPIFWPLDMKTGLTPSNTCIKDLINENNNLLFSVPYQHYTNAIEGYFNVLKSRLNKKNGITYDDLVKNVKSIIKEIPKQTYHKLFIGSYQRSKTYKPKKSRKRH